EIQALHLSLQPAYQLREGLHVIAGGYRCGWLRIATRTLSVDSNRQKHCCNDRRGNSQNPGATTIVVHGGLLHLNFPCLAECNSAKLRPRAAAGALPHTSLLSVARSTYIIFSNARRIGKGFVRKSRTRLCCGREPGSYRLISELHGSSACRLLAKCQQV